MKHKRLFTGVLIVLPFGLPFEWSADYEFQTARELVTRHATVIAYLPNEGKTLFRWIFSPSPLFEIRQGVTIYRPLHFLPLHRFRIIRTINHWIATKLLLCIISHRAKWKDLPKIFWTFSLQRAVYPQWFGPKFYKIYDCVDMFMTGRTQDTETWQHEERRVINGSDIIFTNSRVLFEQKRRTHPRVFLLPEGMFVPELFPLSRHMKEPPLIRKLPHPRVLFVGNINTRLDFMTIRRAATALPDYSFIFIGSIDRLFSGPVEISLTKEVDAWRRRINVHVLPAVPKKDIASYIKFSDVGFIPYDINQQFNKYCFPIKALEYFSMGKPVVSSAMETMRSFSPLALTYVTPDGAVAALRRVVSRPWPAAHRRRQRRIALSNSVAEKLSKAENILHTYFLR